MVTRNTSRGIRALIGLTLVATMLAVVPQPAVVAAPLPAEAENPNLEAACGIDVILVVDESSSIRRAYATDDVRDAYRSFLLGLAGTGSRVAVIEFSDSARVARGYTEVTSATVAGTFESYIADEYQPSGTTNWDAALEQALTLGTADLVFFISDGSPNRFNPGSFADPLGAAIEEANALKALGTHMFALAVGSGLTNSFGRAALISISGPDEWPDAGLGLRTDDFALVTRFEDLETALRDVAIGLCGGTVTVTKKVQDLDGNVTATPGWHFDGALAGATPPLGVDPTDGNTGPLGTVTFSWASLATQSLTITEPITPGFVLDSASCINNVGGAVPTVAVPNGLTIEVGPFDIVVCEFLNRQLPFLPLDVTKTVDPPTRLEPGGDFNYTVVVTNTNGPGSGFDFEVTGVTDTAAGDITSSCVPEPTVILTPGDSLTCQFTLTHTGTAGDTFTNRAFAIASDPLANGRSSEVEVVLGDAVVHPTVTKTPNPAAVAEDGGDATYTVGVTNPSTVDTMTLTDIVDDAFGVIASTTAAASIPAPDTTCDEMLGVAGLVLAPGAADSCTFTVALSGDFSGPPHVNTATVSGTDDDGSDVEGSATATVGFLNSDSVLTVTKTADPSRILDIGGPVQFTVTMRNDSGVDTIVAEIVEDSAFGVIAEAGVGAVDIPAADTTCDELLGATGLLLLPGQLRFCSFTVVLPPGAGGTSHDNVVTVSGTDDDNLPVSASGATSVGYDDPPSSIDVTKTADPASVAESGGTVTFTVDVFNSSPTDTVTLDLISDDAFGIVASTTFPADVAAADTDCDELLGATGLVLAVGESASCSFVAFLAGQPGTTHTNTVTMSGIDDDTDTVSGAGSATVDYLDVLSSIEVTKTPRFSVVLEPGGVIDFTIGIVNTSPADAVTITAISDDTFGLIATSDPGATPAVAPDDTSCDELLGTTGYTLAVGGAITCRFSGFIGGVSGDEHTNTVTVAYVDDDGTTGDGSGSTTVSVTDTLFNPDLPSSCGIDMVLVLDESNSIRRSRATGDVTDAVLAFLDALSDTGSRVALVEFSDTAREIFDFVEVTDDTIDDLFKPYLFNTDAYAGNQGYYPRGTTNWDDALAKARAINERQIDAGGPAAAMTVIITDGAPNRWNAGSTPNAVDAAVDQANGIKLLGTKMFGIGVGSAGTSLSTEANIVAITGPDKWPHGDPGIDTDDYALIASFSGLPQALRDFALELCGGSVIVVKFAENPAGTFEPAPGWEFTASVPSGSPFVDPGAVQVTNAAGRARFRVLSTATETITIIETGQSGFALDSVSCRDQDGLAVPATFLGNGLIVDVARDQIVACSFFNVPVP